MIRNHGLTLAHASGGLSLALATVVAAFLSMIGAIAQDEGPVTHDVAISPDLRTVVLGIVDSKSSIVLRSTAYNTELLRISGPGPVRAFAFSPDGLRVVATNDHGKCPVYDVKTGKVVLELAGHSEWVSAAAFGRSFILTGGYDRTTRVWDAERGIELRKLMTKERIGAVGLSADEALVAVGDTVGWIHFHERATGKLLRSVDVGDSACTNVAFSPDGKWFAIADHKGALVLVDPASGDIRHSFQTGTPVHDLVFSADSARLAAACGDRRARVVDVASMTLQLVETGSSCIAVRMHGRAVWAADLSGAVRRFDLPAPAPTTESRPETRPASRESEH